MSYNELQKQRFLDDYAAIIPVILELRNSGRSLPQIAKELNTLGYLTRENKAFSHVQVLRILSRANNAVESQPLHAETTQTQMIDSELQQEVEQLKSENLALRGHVDELQTEMSKMMAQLAELQSENARLKSENAAMQSDTPHVAAEQRARPARSKVAVDVRQSIIQKAMDMHAVDSGRGKLAIARELSVEFNVESETIRDWLKKLW